MRNEGKKTQTKIYSDLMRHCISSSYVRILPQACFNIFFCLSFLHWFRNDFLFRSIAWKWDVWNCSFQIKIWTFCFAIKQWKKQLILCRYAYSFLQSSSSSETKKSFWRCMPQIYPHFHKSIHSWNSRSNQIRAKFTFLCYVLLCYFFHNICQMQIKPINQSVGFVILWWDLRVFFWHINFI